MKENILKFICLIILVGFVSGCSEEVIQENTQTTKVPSTSIQATSTSTTTTTTTSTTTTSTTSISTTTSTTTTTLVTTKTTKAKTTKKITKKTTKKKTTKKTSKQASSNLPLKAICNDGTISYQDDPSKSDYRGMCSKHRGIRQKLGRVK